MHPDFWFERWQKNEIGFHEAEGNAYLRAYWPALSVPEGSRVLVPLCGKSKDLLWLEEAGYTVVGCELVESAVRDFFRENGLVPRVAPLAEAPNPAEEIWSTNGISIIRSDFFNLDRSILGEVSAVFDRAALIALPANMRKKYAHHLSSLLSVGTEVLLVTLDYDQSQMKGPPFAVSDAEVRALYEPRFSITQLARRDVLAENARFRDRGLNSLFECVYRLRKES